MTSEPFLRVRDLRLHFHGEGGRVHALGGVDLDLQRGETLGLVGESGCGKSTLGLALTRLLAEGAEIESGRIEYHRPTGAGETREWVDLLSLTERELQGIRGRHVSMIFQEPMTSLNPVLKVGDQLTEVLLRHGRGSARLTAWDRFWLARGFRTRGYRRAEREARPRAADMLRRLDVPDPAGTLDRYPHELSGGMRQRIMIGMALLCDPDLLVADEPTTALDVTVQAQITELLRETKERTRSSILLITHHLGLVAETCDRVAVMYAGAVVETAPVDRLFDAPAHPYTRALLQSVPRLDRSRDRPLPSIPGTVPDLRQAPRGCRFAARCPVAIDRCHEAPPPACEVAPGHRVACHLYEDGADTTPRVPDPPEVTA